MRKIRIGPLPCLGGTSTRRNRPGKMLGGPFRRLPLRPASGFTLLEMITAVSIITVLVAIAVVQYQLLVVNSAQRNLFAVLADLQMQGERMFQSAQTYEGICPTLMARYHSGTKSLPFSLTCTSTANRRNTDGLTAGGFTLTATSTRLMPGTGMHPRSGDGNYDDFVYTIDQANNRRTTYMWGVDPAIGAACWLSGVQAPSAANQCQILGK